jgi:hypothetical protein
MDPAALWLCRSDIDMGVTTVIAVEFSVQLILARRVRSVTWCGVFRRVGINSEVINPELAASE